MRVLFSAHGAYGHLLPLAGLARAFDEAGHDVLVAVGEDLRETAERLGLRVTAAGLSDGGLVEEARRRWPEVQSQPPAKWAVRMFTEIAAPAMAADLAAVLREWKPDLVVREEGEHGAPVAAFAAGVPWVTHRWGSPEPPPGDAGRGADLVAPLWRAAGLPQPTPRQLLGEAVIDPCPTSLTSGDGSAVSVRPTSPAVGRRDDEGPPPRKPAAYVGFGTVPLYRDRPELVARAVEALLLAGFEHVVVTTPDSELAARLSVLGGDRVRVTGWVSLDDLLPACRLVIAHGGAGTVLSALTAGVPLVLLPSGSPSQLRMTEACLRRGVASRPDDDGASVATLRASIDRVVSDPSFTEASAEVAAEIAAMPAPREIVPVLERLVSHDS